MKIHAIASVLLLAGSSTLTLAARIPTLNDNVITCNQDSRCSSKIVFGRSYRVLQTDRFIVMVSISDEGAYTRADVSIENNTGISQNLSPQDFRVEVISPRPKVLPYVPPAELQNLPISPLPAQKATRPGPSFTPTASPPEASPAPEALAKEVTPKESEEREAAQKHLEVTALPPGEVIRGRVYFQRDIKAKLFNVVLPVAGLVFEFPCSTRH